MSRCWKPTVFVVAVALASSVFAYDYPLSSEAIREAYFIGNRRDTGTTDFIARSEERRGGKECISRW